MIRRAFVSAIVAEVLTTLSILASFRLASITWGADGLSEWVLMRRVVSLLWPVVLCGLEVSLTLAAAKAVNADRRLESTIVIAGFATVIATGGALLTTGLCAPDFVASLLFGSASLQGLVVPTFCMIVALSAYAVIYAFLRGKMLITAASGLQIVALCALPPAAILLVADGPRKAMLLIAAVTVALTLFVSTRWLLHGVDWRDTLHRSRAIVHDGLPRVPAAFGIMALFGVPPLTVARFAGLEQGAFLSLALTIVTMSGSLLTPVTVVLLPLSARAARAGRSVGTPRQRRHLLAGAILLGALVIVVVWVFSSALTNALLGHQDPLLSRLLGWSAFAAAPYIYFVCSRPVIDANAPSQTVTRIVLGALIAYAVTFLLLMYFEFLSLDAALAAHIISLYVLAGAASLQLIRMGRVPA